MEPMTLGSPVHSPVHAPSFAGHAAYSSPAPHHSSAASPMTATTFSATGGSHLNPHQPTAATGHGFLPGYLMGDASFSQQSTPTTGRLLSPTKLNRSVSIQQSSTPQTPRLQQQQPTFLTPNSRTPSEKPSGGGGGGPPTTGLYSSLLNKGTPTPASRFGTPSNMHSTPVPTTPQLSFGSTPVQDRVLGAVHAAGSCQEANHNWVTVFGFPPSAASFILSQFSQLGTILQHHIPPNGNWMHLKYQTKMQAQKALGKSNKVMGGSIMIGVSVCSDPEVTNDDNCANNASILNHSHVLAGNSSMAPMQNQLNHSVATAAGGGGAGLADQSVTTLNSSLGGSYLNRSSIRPLTQAYKAANGDADILNRTQTPNKSSGFVGKAMGYIFGW